MESRLLRWGACSDLHLLHAKFIEAKKPWPEKRALSHLKKRSFEQLRKRKGKMEIEAKNKKRTTYTLLAVFALTLSNSLAPCDPTRDDVVENPAWKDELRALQQQVNAPQSQNAALVN